MEQIVKAWMSGDPVSLRPEASALEALERMVDRGIRHLPVVDAESRVVGILTVEDLRAALPLPLSLQEPLSVADRPVVQDCTVGEIMTHEPFVALCDTPLADAAELLAENRIGCLPVVDDEGRLAGILSETDVLHALVTTLRAGGTRERRSKESEFEDLVEDLRRERARIAERLDQLHEVERKFSTIERELPMDEAERGADRSEVRMAETLDEMSIRRLRGIDRALDHAAQGHLSICDGCGGNIPAARLRALPGTTLCIRCVRAGEQPA